MHRRNRGAGRDGEIIHHGSDAGDRAGVVASQGAGGRIGSRSAESDHALGDGNLNVLASERGFCLQLRMNIAGNLLVGAEGRLSGGLSGGLRGLPGTANDDEGQSNESEDEESGVFHWRSLSAEDPG